MLGKLPKVNGSVYNVEPNCSRGWYIGGSFDRVGTFLRNNLARINSDETVATWNPEANNSVFCFVTTGTTIYGGGNFTNIGERILGRIAALDATTGAVRN